MKALLFCVFLTVVTGSPHIKPKFQNVSYSASPTKSTRIVGGKDALPGELPYQISIQDVSFGFPFHFCGGSIVSEKWVLTAAHCFDKMDLSTPEYVQVVAGEHNLVEMEFWEQTIGVDEIRIHEKYDKWTVSNDIALLKLAQSIRYDEYSQPIILPSKDHLASGNCIVSGWGATEEEGDPSDILQKATVPIMSDADCKEVFGESEIDDCMICAGVIHGGIDACEGDSGGPLACKDTGETYLAGVVSWGYGCARPGFAGVYSEMSCYVDWVNEHIRS
uniref:Putative trypsin n=1 Tax=Crangon crangon TaxID=491138 RepID=A0A2Z4BXG6_CRACN|nr:putative trypsin [Crangon crangon]